MDAEATKSTDDTSVYGVRTGTEKYIVILEVDDTANAGTGPVAELYYFTTREATVPHENIYHTPFDGYTE